MVGDTDVEGKRIAFSSAGDVYVYDREHERKTRLTVSNSSSNPVWTPNGKHLVFRARVPPDRLCAGSARTALEVLKR